MKCPKTADSSNLDLRIEVSTNVNARRPDLFKVMVAPKESANGFRRIQSHPPLQSAPKVVVFVGWTSKQEVFDVHGEQ